MRKIFRRLLVTTLALAIVMSGIIPGTEALEVQAKTVNSSELYTIEVFMKGDGITFTRDYTLNIEGETKTYTTGETWINESDNVYYVDKEEESKPVEQPKTPETHYGMFQEDAIRKLNVAIENVNKAAANGTANQTKKVELNTGIWVSFHKSVYDEIQKCTVPVSITFIYQGTRYVVTIPANADVLSLVDENGYCGFLNLGAHYGYDSIEKLW